MGVTIENIINGQTRRLEEFIQLFLELFPQYAGSVERLRMKANLPENSNPNFIAHQWLVEVDGQAVGMTSFKYSPARELGLTVYVGVRPDFRGYEIDGRRFSEWLIRASMRQIQADAQKSGHGLPAGLCFEVEPAHLLSRYRQFGFEEFPLEYYEPLFARARQGWIVSDFKQVNFQRRFLGYFPLLPVKNEPVTPDLLNRVIMMFYKDHYGIREDHPMLQRVLTSIRPLTLEGEK